jgi:hypothetical protein
MTHLRKMMLEELERRNYSAATTRRYLRFVERFAHPDLYSRWYRSRVRGSRSIRQCYG